MNIAHYVAFDGAPFPLIDYKFNNNTVTFYVYKKHINSSTKMLIERYEGVVGILGQYDGKVAGAMGLQKCKTLSVTYTNRRYEIVVEYDHLIAGG